MSIQSRCFGMQGERRIQLILSSFLISFFFFSGNSSGSYSCRLPIGAQEFFPDQVEANSFDVVLDSALTPSQADSVIDAVERCQSEIASLLETQKKKLTHLYEDRATLQGYSNLEDLADRLKILKQEKDDIRETASKNLEQIVFKGIYAAMVEGNLDDTRGDLIRQAKHLISTHAIEDLRSVAIESLSEVHNGRVTLDSIVRHTSGEMNIESAIVENRSFLNKKSQLFYVAIVNVYPLKGDVKEKVEEQVDGFALDILPSEATGRFLEEVKKFSGSFAFEMVEKLPGMTDHDRWFSIRASVGEANSGARLAEENIIQDLEKRLFGKDREIESVSRKLETGRRDLGVIYESIGFSCVGTTHSGACLNKAIGFIDAEIGDLISMIMTTGEREPVTRIGEIEGEGRPSAEIQSLVGKFYANLKTTFGERKQLLSHVVVENERVAGYIRKEGVVVTRVPSRLLLYPFTSVGKLKILLVMFFDVRRDTDTGAGSEDPGDPSDDASDKIMSADGSNTGSVKPKRGERLLTEKQSEEATTIVEEEVKSEEGGEVVPVAGDEDFYYSLRRLLDQGSDEEALRKALERIRDGRETARICNLVGDIYNSKKLYKKAVSFLRKAIELDPMLAYAHYNLALAYHSIAYLTGVRVHYAAAITEYRLFFTTYKPSNYMVSVVERDNYDANMNIGYCYRGLGRLRTAQIFFNRARVPDNRVYSPRDGLSYNVSDSSRNTNIRP